MCITGMRLNIVNLALAGMQKITGMRGIYLIRRSLRKRVSVETLTVPRGEYFGLFT
jgi:hypothetical protein